MLQAPCYKCEDRHIACHDTCSKYILYKQKKKLIKDQEVQRRMGMAFTLGPRYNKKNKIQ